MARRLRLITFDLDDTLWDMRPVLVRAEATVAQWSAQHCPELAERFDRDALLDIRRELVARDPALRHDISTLRREATRVALERCGRPASEAARLAAECFAVFLDARHAVEPFDGVEECLQALGREYLLGVITNGNADVFRLPLGRYFRFAIRAESVGHSKPDPRHFAAALRAGEAEPAQTLHVGDHHEHDVQGARGAGMRAAWFNPAGRAWPGDEPADAEFRCFEELPALVRRLDG